MSENYDVIIIGDVTPAQLTFRRGDKTVAVLDKIRDRVIKNGTGVMFLGGEQSFRGMPADLLPVTVQIATRNTNSGNTMVSLRRVPAHVVRVMNQSAESPF